MSSPATSIRQFSLQGDRRFIVPAIAIVALVVAVVLSIGIGPVYIGPGRVVQSLLGTTGTSDVFINQVRLPRVLVGVMVGASLAMSGAILQGVTRNPLADPHIFGISAGAGVVAVSCIVFFPQLPREVVQPLALIGGLMGGGLAYTMAWRGGVTASRLALAGIAVTSMLTAITTGILVTSAFSAQIGLRFLIGGLLLRNWTDVHLLLPYFVVGTLATLLMSKQLNIIAMGDEVAVSLGQSVERTRLIFVALAALLASSAVSIAGLIGFLGLIVPHFVRLIIGNDYRFILPTSALIGAILLVTADTVARTAFDPQEIPVGVLTAVLGGPVFILLGEEPGVKLGSEQLSAGYPATSELVIEGLDIGVEEGEIVSLVGPNGSGKSTLLRALARVLKPKSGVVILDGKSIAEWPTREVARRLALLPQGPTLNASMTVEELVWMGRSPHQGILGLPTPVDREAVEHAIEETGIAPLAKRQVALLSGGERQRAWLAMAIAQQPRVLLLDEPTTFLDLNHQLEVLDLIRQLNQHDNLTVVMVLHDLNQAARYSHRICVLKDGRIYGDGTPEAILTPATLRDVFQIEGRIIEGPEGIGMIIVPVSRTTQDRE